MRIIQSRLIFVFKMYLFKVFGANCDFIFSKDEKKYLVHIDDNSHDSSIFTKIAKSFPQRTRSAQHYARFDKA